MILISSLSSSLIPDESPSGRASRRFTQMGKRTLRRRRPEERHTQAAIEQTTHPHTPTDTKPKPIPKQ